MELEAHPTVISLRQQLELERDLRQKYESQVIDLELRLENVKSDKNDTENGINWRNVLNPFFAKQYKLLIKENAALKAEVFTLKKELDHSQQVLSRTLEESARHFYEKQNLSDEIEDLTAALFQEANRMVACEKKLRMELEASKMELSKELSEVMQKLKKGLQKQMTRLSQSVIFDEKGVDSLLNHKSALLDAD